MLAGIADAADEPDPDLARAEIDLRSADTQIARLVNGVAEGTFEHEEIAAKLRGLREQRDTTQAVLAVSATSRARLDAAAIGALLDELGGFVGLTTQLTREETIQLMGAADLQISYDHPDRTARFEVKLGRGVSVCVGGGT